MGTRSNSDLWYWLFAIFPCIALTIVLQRENTIWLFYGVAALSLIDFGVRRDKSWHAVFGTNWVVMISAVFLYRFISIHWMYPSMYDPELAAELDLGYTFEPETDLILLTSIAAMSTLLFAVCLPGRLGQTKKLLNVAFFVLFAYPALGWWAWGRYSGWPPPFHFELPFRDFRGGSVVYGIAGWSALGVTLLLGIARQNYTPSRPRTWATVIGSIAWWAYCGGFETDFTLLRINRYLATAFGVVSSVLIGRGISGSWQTKHLVTGVTAGFASIAAPEEILSNPMAIALGVSSGFFALLFSLFLEKLKMCDETGLLSALAIGGTMGTIFRGFLPHENIHQQLLGSAICIGLGLTLFVVIGIATSLIEKLRSPISCAK